jgi:hypothetical protein
VTYLVSGRSIGNSLALETRVVALANDCSMRVTERSGWSKSMATDPVFGDIPQHQRLAEMRLLVTAVSDAAMSTTAGCRHWVCRPTVAELGQRSFRGELHGLVFPDPAADLVGRRDVVGLDWKRSAGAWPPRWRDGCASQTLDENGAVYVLTVHYDDECSTWRALRVDHGPGDGDAA